MVGVRERPPAADGDETGVAVFGEDHGCTRPVASAQRLALPAAGEEPAREGEPPEAKTKPQKRPEVHPAGGPLFYGVMVLKLFYLLSCVGLQHINSYFFSR